MPDKLGLFFSTTKPALSVGPGHLLEVVIAALQLQ